MLAASHIVAGGVVGSYIGNPFLAFLVGFILHFILDAIPHFDTIGDNILSFKQMSLIIADLLIGVALIIYVIKPDLSPGSPFIWGAVGGMLPDLLDNVPFWRNAFRKSKVGGKIHNFHGKIQSRALENHPFVGMLTQYIIITLFIWLYFSTPLTK